jgi:hypothetical protein
MHWRPSNELSVQTQSAMEATSTERSKQASKQAPSKQAKPASKQARVPAITEMTKRSLSDVIRRSNAHESEEAYRSVFSL